MNRIQTRTNRKQGLGELATVRQIFSPENNVEKYLNSNMQARTGPAGHREIPGRPVAIKNIT